MKSRFARSAGLLVLVAAVASACGGDDHPQTTLSPKGPEAQTIADLVTPVFLVAAVVFVFVIGGALFVAWKFRAHGDDDFFSEDEAPKQVHGAFKVEIGWTIVPALILIGVGVFTVAGIFNLAKPAPKGSVHVEVIGQQWWWEYRYDLNGDGKYDGITTANDLVIPAGEDVQLSITARDVIHSFWIPALNGKKDAVPNRHSPLVLKADKAGQFVGQCTEYCGLSHANMRARAISVPRDEFDRWARNQQKAATPLPDDGTDTAALGQQYFVGAQCSQCHVVDGLDTQNFDQETITNKNFGVAEPKSAVEVPHEIKKESLQVSRAAPNLTHFITRTSFAGGFFDLRIDDGPDGYCTKLGLHWSDTQANINRCLNVPDLKSWLRNPPGQLPMAPDGVPGRTGGRGMPNLNLSETQIDQVVAYLETLK